MARGTATSDSARFTSADPEIVEAVGAIRLVTVRQEVASLYGLTFPAEEPCKVS